MIISNRNASFATSLVAMLLLVYFLISNILVFACSIASSVTSDVDQPVVAEHTVELNGAPVLFADVVYEDTYDAALAEQQRSQVLVAITKLESLINSGVYTADAHAIMLVEIDRLRSIEKKYVADAARYYTWESEYEYATKVYKFLMKHGYSKEITCAIIGNMMVETGGNTLNLVPDLYDADTGTYYGLCQWSLYWRPEADKLSFEEQLDYLMSDIEYEINTFGFCYKAGFDYETFINMTDPQEAAVAFAMTYERCATWSYNKRFVAAGVAYEYFA